ncbi:NlpC/P60 family protein [Salinicola sp. CPA57]|uniref:NlpC/P60 family protein n=1 Tax=Salinicola sp. CPA57 TaxID=1949080 RepID=UPI000DA22C1A|nr:NlpC/P60 family protein [Salinicola sp. CPA57]
MLTTEQEQQIKQKAIDGYPLETVWLLTEKAGLYQVQNVSDDPENHFHVSKNDMIKATKEGLLAVIHSHPDYPACPSESDMRTQLALDVPFAIVATDGKDATALTWWGDNIEKAPLIGRGFIHGVQDCYSLIRDYYELELNVNLPEYPRSWEWWKLGQDLYSKNHESAGFIRVYEPQRGDMIYMQIRSGVPNHGAVYLGNNLILHHVTASNPVDQTRISKREPIARWLPYITHYYRHKSQF